MGLTIDFDKLEAEAPELLPAARALEISLDKDYPDMRAHTAEVVVMMDASASMEDDDKLFYTNNKVQDLVEMIVPLGLQFDDNGRIDVGFFGHSAYMAGDVGVNDFRGCVQRLRPRQLGSTNYADAIRKTRELYVERHGSKQQTGGFLRRRTTTEVTGPQAMPMLVLVPTDGEPNPGTKHEIEEELRLASHLPIFYQFLGIQGRRSRVKFEFLKRLSDLEGRLIDNAGFVEVTNFHDLSPNELYTKIVFNEYPDWVKEAQRIGLLVAA